MDDLKVKNVVETPAQDPWGWSQAGAYLFRCTNRAKVPDKFYPGGRLEGEQIAAGEAREDTAESTGPGGGVFAGENSKACYFRLLHITKIVREAICGSENSHARSGKSSKDDDQRPGEGRFSSSQISLVVIFDYDIL